MAKEKRYIGSVDDSQKLLVKKFVKSVKLRPIGEDEDAKASGTLHWSYNREEFAVVRYTVYLKGSKALLQLNFNTSSGKSVEQFIVVKSSKSNLGVGFVWWFVCPKTKKNCKELIYHNGVFAHRSYHEPAGVMYKQQKESKKMREFERLYGGEFEISRLYEELHSKGFKKYYNGKPTKRFLRIQKRLAVLRKKEQNAIDNYLDYESYYMR